MIEFQDVTVCYEPQKLHPVRSLDALNLKIERGDWVFLVGPSGAGKTSLLKLIFAGTRAQSGRIWVDGTDISALAAREVPALRRKIGIVFQDFQLLGEKTAWENVAFTLRVIGTPQSEIIKSVPRALETVGLTHRAGAFPHELSGGEQQRIAIARAIVNNPKILLADEPTGNLDPQTAREVGELLTKINHERGTTIVMATHDRHFVDTLARRVVRLEAGRVVGDENPGTYSDEIPPPAAPPRREPPREVTPFDAEHAFLVSGPLNKMAPTPATIETKKPEVKSSEVKTPEIALPETARTRVAAAKIAPAEIMAAPQNSIEFSPKLPNRPHETPETVEVSAIEPTAKLPVEAKPTVEPEALPKPIVPAVLPTPAVAPMAQAPKVSVPAPITALSSAPTASAPTASAPTASAPTASAPSDARPQVFTPPPIPSSARPMPQVEERISSFPVVRPMARRIAPEEITAEALAAPPRSGHALDPNAQTAPDSDAPLGSPENPIVQYE